MSPPGRENFIDLERDIESNENLEEQLEREWEQEVDAKRFEGEVLFSTQGLGKIMAVKTETGEQKIYIKGDHAEASLKDLCRFCRRDDMLIARLSLAKWMVLQNDLIYLLLGYPQDKVLTYYVVILLESLTNPVVFEQCTRVQQGDLLLRAMQDYKFCFLRPLVFATIINHLAECVEGQSKVHQQMIELVVLLIRNLLQVPDAEINQSSNSSNSVRCNLQRALLEVMIEEKVMPALIYISQDYNTPLKKKLAPIFVDIFYKMFTGFEPEWLLRDEEEERAVYMRSMQNEQARRNREASKVGPRHSNFGCKIMIHKENGSRMIKNPLNAQRQSNINPHQRHKPVLRALALKHKTIFVKHLIFADENNREQIRLTAIDFIQNCFNRLVDAVFDELSSEQSVDAADKVSYFVLVAYFLRLTRCQCRRNQDRKVKQVEVDELSSELVNVAAALQITQFELIYQTILKESTQNKKKNFNYRLYFAAVTAMMEFMYVIRELSLSISGIDRKNAQILMQNVFSRDISRVLRIGFQYCTTGLFEDSMLKILVETTSLFFDLLESYSRGKSLSIKTNKLLAKKKKVKQQEADGTEPKSQDEDENDNDEDEDEDQPIYRERKFNLMSEFAIVVEYSIVDKVFHLISGDKILSNPKELNTAIYKYLQRIVDLLKADWLFYQVSYLNVINQILNRTEIIVRLEYKNLITLLRRIARSFIEKLGNNSLLGVEALFKFPNSTIKDQILTNYEETQEINQPQRNENEEVNVNIQQVVMWTRQEDQELIDNYERFKDFENPHEQLSQYLASLGHSVKSPYEVRKRIKKYNLQRGTQLAQAKFKEVHERMALRKEEAMINSVQELIKQYPLGIFEERINEVAQQIIAYTEFRGTEPIEIPLPPLNNAQFDFLENKDVHVLLLCLDVTQPGQGEVYWRVLPSTGTREVESWVSDIMRCVTLDTQVIPKQCDSKEDYNEFIQEKKQSVQRQDYQDDDQEYDDIFN